jgi:hypothetical protein
MVRALVAAVLGGGVLLGAQQATTLAREKPAPGVSTTPVAARARFLEMFARAYFPGRTGQVMIVPREGDIITRPDPDVLYMHGSPWPYDTRIPMLFAGPAIVPGTYATASFQQDVAVTLARALGTAMPPTASGRVLPVLRPGAQRPAAVLLISLDAMRPDYFDVHAQALPTLTRLRRRSAWFTNARVNYVPSNTAVGHATISTGADPRVHGTTGNNLYDRVSKARHDTFAGWQPQHLMALTLADVWQLETRGTATIVAQGSAPTASTALAGHGSCQLNGVKIVLAGYDDKTGHWGSNPDCFTLPADLADFDAKTLWASDSLWMGHKIDSPAAVKRSGLFPRFETDSFVRLIERQPIGTDDVPDLLLLNFKGADYVGHKYGPKSPEVAATLAEMDKQLARILAALEAKVGENYLIAVTADHGMPTEPSAPSRRHMAPAIVDRIHDRFDREGRTLVTYYEPENSQIFIDRTRLEALKLQLRDIASFLASQPFVFAAFTEDEVRRATARLK